MAEHSEVLGLAAQIVSAHVSHNAVPSDQLPGLIRQVFNSLALAEQEPRCHRNRNLRSP